MTEDGPEAWPVDTVIYLAVIHEYVPGCAVILAVLFVHLPDNKDVVDCGTARHKSCLIHYDFITAG